MVIATVAMTTVLGFWNMFAGPDREKAAAKAELEQIKPTLTPTQTAAPTALAVATMPPPGYTILYGGEAPKPQIIVQQSSGGGGGGGGGDVGGGGGGGGGAVTSSGSS